MIIEPILFDMIPFVLLGFLGYWIFRQTHLGQR